MNILTFLRNDSIESILVTIAGFIIAVWYVRGKVVDKKSVSKGLLKYLHDLFPIGMMLFGIYLSYAVEKVAGGAIMVLAAFVYVSNYVAPSIDKYDSVHRTTILSLGYTREEYAIRYLFPKTRRVWLSGAINFFVFQWITLIWYDILKYEKVKMLSNMFLISSIVFVIVGLVISILKNHKEE